jgi:hypothetical protein
VRHLRVFLIATPFLAVLYRVVAHLPWWPDAAILGVSTGAMASFTVFFWGSVFRAARHLWSAIRGTRRLIRARFGRRRRLRPLTTGEHLVLAEVRAHWGAENTEREVIFSDNDEAVLFVRGPAEAAPLLVGLTNLANWYQEGLITWEDVKREVATRPTTPSGSRHS